MLNSVKAALLARVSAMGAKLPGCREEEALQIQAKLKRLLQASFMYLGLQELREVPMAIMSTLEQVLFEGRITVPPQARQFIQIASILCLRHITSNMMEQVPPVFLKQLTGDKAIFKELPAKVQRQVWEFDKNLLQQDALPPVGQYKYEVATIMRCEKSVDPEWVNDSDSGCSCLV